MTITDASQESLRSLMLAVEAGAADAEEIHATAARLSEGDGASWLLEWTGLAGAAWAAAVRAPTARGFLHAASYYAAALAGIADSDGLVSEAALWLRQRHCWDEAVRLMGGQRIAIPYARTDLPGYFFPAADQAAGRRPLVVIDHGGRHCTSHALALGGAAAHAHGFHWMTFDGPGSQAALFRRRLVLRSDWEAVLRPVVNAMRARADVDAGRIAVIAVEHASYGLTRALAFEHRFAAAVVVPGVVDASTPWLAALPEPARTALLADDRAAFGRELAVARLFRPGLDAVLERNSRGYVLDPGDPFDVFQRVRRHRVGPEIEQIRTPVLVHERLNETLYPGQARALYADLPDVQAELVIAGDPVQWLAGRLQ